MIGLAKHAVACAVLLNVCGACKRARKCHHLWTHGLRRRLARSGGSSISRVYSGGSAGSNLGFRGVENLGGGLSAVFA